MAEFHGNYLYIAAGSNPHDTAATLLTAAQGLSLPATEVKTASADGFLVPDVVAYASGLLPHAPP